MHGRANWQTEESNFHGEQTNFSIFLLGTRRQRVLLIRHSATCYWLEDRTRHLMPPFRISGMQGVVPNAGIGYYGRIVGRRIFREVNKCSKIYAEGEEDQQWEHKRS